MGGTLVNSRTGFQPVIEASRTGFQPVNPPAGSSRAEPAGHPATVTPSPRHPLLPHSGFDLLRLILGLILLLAAGLKAHQLATDPLVTLAPRPSALAPLPASLAPLLHSRPCLIGVVECELLFGLVLLSGILPRLTWALSLLCFGGFALISLYKGISGDATCGCFGRVPVNPWLHVRPGRDGSPRPSPLAAPRTPPFAHSHVFPFRNHTGPSASLPAHP